MGGAKPAARMGLHGAEDVLMAGARTRLAGVGLLLVLIAGCGKQPAAQEQDPLAAMQSGPSEETRPANAQNQKPAFAGQTRAPRLTANITLDVKQFAEGLDFPWAMEFLPDGRLLVTEKGGDFRFVGRDGKLSAPTKVDLPIYTEMQGGLLDVALAPDFESSGNIYFTFAEKRGAENGTALATAKLDAHGAKPVLRDVKVIFRQMPGFKSPAHFGSRIVFLPDGTLFLTLGERALPESRKLAQDLNTHFGKVLHLNADGTPAAGNPFLERADARPEIWSYGHRNIQAAALEPRTNRLWTVEHGPMGGDEVNRPEPGRNYGWPVITYGVDYSGKPEGDGITAKEGMEQPVYYWDPNIAPGGATFHDGKAFPAWRGSLFIAGLSGQKLVRLSIRDGRVVGEEWFLQDRGNRFRDVKEGPDGSLYVLAEEGVILRLSPAAK